MKCERLDFGGGLENFAVLRRIYDFCFARVSRSCGRRLSATHFASSRAKCNERAVGATGSPLVIGVGDTEDSKPKDGRRAEVYK